LAICKPDLIDSPSKKCPQMARYSAPQEYKQIDVDLLPKLFDMSQSKPSQMRQRPVTQSTRDALGDENPLN